MSNHSLECKICSSKMNVEFAPINSTFVNKYVVCPNGCYEELHSLNSIYIYIFGEKFEIHSSQVNNHNGFEFADDIQKAIDYWIANERYLLKLLDGYVPISHKPKFFRHTEQYGIAVINSKAIARMTIT